MLLNLKTPLTDTGNEPILTGVKIIGNFLHSVEVIQTGDTVKLDSTAKRPLVFYTETHEECMEECKSRQVMYSYAK